MIKRLDALLQSRLFRAVRIGQFLLAVLVFTTFALMPTRYVQEIPSSAPTLHFIGNFLLFCSAWAAWFGRTKLGLLILLLVPYSVAIELAQWLTPNRQVDQYDLFANIAGLGAGYLFALALEGLWSGLKAHID